MKHLKRYRLPIVIVGAFVAIVAFLAFRPDKLFVDDAVNESLADAFSAETTDDLPGDAVSSGDTAAPTTTTAAPGDDTPSTTEAPPASEAPAPEDEGPRSVAAGAWYGIDHAASGSAAIYEQDGQYVLRFEDDTDIQNGPDLYVWVLPSADYEGGDPSDYLDLGKIKGNVGGQNYALPAEFDPEVHRSVLIWCLRFAVPFAAVPLA